MLKNILTAATVGLEKQDSIPVLYKASEAASEEIISLVEEQEWLSDFS